MSLERTKAGLVLLTAEWFSEISYDVTEEDTANISAMVQDNARMAVETIGKHFDVVHPKIITTIEDAKEACREFKAADVDVLIIAHLIYSGDDPLIEVLLQMKGTPVILWCYNIYRKLPRITKMCDYFSVTGAPGMLQGIAPMKRMGVKFVFGVPGSEKLDKAFHDWSLALSVKKAMRSLNIAAIGRRYEPMSGAWIDELRLKTVLGPKVVWISAFEYAQMVKAVDEELLREFVNEQKAAYRVSDQLTDEDIMTASRASIACYDLCKKYNCEVLSVQDMDQEIHDMIGCRPQLTYQKMFDEGISCGMEEDIDSALCVWILHNLAETPAMYGEVFTYDEEENFLAIGHAAPHDLRLAGDNPIEMIPDQEFMYADRCQGAWNMFVTPPGPVTLVCLFEDCDTYRFIVASGEALDMPTWVTGGPHALVRPKMAVEEFLKAVCEIGVTQHFALCFGDVKERIAVFGRLMETEVVDLDEVCRGG